MQVYLQEGGPSGFLQEILAKISQMNLTVEPKIGIIHPFGASKTGKSLKKPLRTAQKRPF